MPTPRWTEQELSQFPQSKAVVGVLNANYVKKFGMPKTDEARAHWAVSINLTLGIIPVTAEELSALSLGVALTTFRAEWDKAEPQQQRRWHHLCLMEFLRAVNKLEPGIETAWMKRKA